MNYDVNERQLLHSLVDWAQWIDSVWRHSDVYDIGLDLEESLLRGRVRDQLAVKGRRWSPGVDRVIGALSEALQHAVRCFTVERSMATRSHLMDGAGAPEDVALIVRGRARAGLAALGEARVAQWEDLAMALDQCGVAQGRREAMLHLILEVRHQGPYLELDFATLPEAPPPSAERRWAQTCLRAALRVEPSPLREGHATYAAFHGRVRGYLRQSETEEGETDGWVWEAQPYGRAWWAVGNLPTPEAALDAALAACAAASLPDEALLWLSAVSSLFPGDWRMRRRGGVWYGPSPNYDTDMPIRTRADLGRWCDQLSEGVDGICLDIGFEGGAMARLADALELPPGLRLNVLSDPWET